MLYEVKPDLIIETGTNSGGSALYMSHLMEAIRPEVSTTWFNLGSPTGSPTE